MNKYKKVIKWVNKFSREEGYVGKIPNHHKYFESTKDLKKARKFTNETSLNSALDLLDKMGETQQNEFYAEDYQD